MAAAPLAVEGEAAATEAAEVEDFQVAVDFSSPTALQQLYKVLTRTFLPLFDALSSFT